MLVQGRPRKTAEELDAEMTNYFAAGGGGDDTSDTGGTTNGVGGTGTEASVDGVVPAETDGDIDMIE